MKNSNRIIKFRAWNPKTKKMGVCFNLIGLQNSILPQLDDLILMQYTGLKDKNGKEIYEGDIVREYQNNKWINEVCWNKEEACFGFGRDGSWSHSWSEAQGSEPSDWEVVGNIYEDKELL